MISTVRIPGDFLLTEYKDAVWQKIEDSVEKSRDFILCFYCHKSSEMPAIANYINDHSNKLKIKTTIKLWDVCKDERVFLDVSKEHTNSRFHINSNDIKGIIQAMLFVENYFEFISNNHIQYTHPNKHQKRNDSNTFDYNKK